MLTDLIFISSLTHCLPVIYTDSVEAWVTKECLASFPGPIHEAFGNKEFLSRAFISRKTCLCCDSTHLFYVSNFYSFFFFVVLIISYLSIHANNINRQVAM